MQIQDDGWTILHKKKTFINHALNGFGEKKILSIAIGGFCRDLNTLYQYHES